MVYADYEVVGKPRHVYVSLLGGTVVTLIKDERFRVKVSPVGGRTIAAKVTVDGTPAYNDGLYRIVSAPHTFSDFVNVATGATEPFTLKEIAIADGVSVAAVSKAQDAMATAGKILVEFKDVVAGVARPMTTTTIATSSALETTAKKALLNGLSTAPPTWAAASLTYTSAAFDLSTDLGAVTIPYRDRSAIIVRGRRAPRAAPRAPRGRPETNLPPLFPLRAQIWLEKEEEEAGGGKRKPDGPSGGSAAKKAKG
jgi:hypothetical protein